MMCEFEFLVFMINFSNECSAISWLPDLIAEVICGQL
jgi:hypothetical protein